MTKQEIRGEAPVLLLEFVFYLCVPAGFFLLLGINNPQLYVPNRTLAITLSTFAVVWVALLRIYGGYQIGKKKTRPIIYNMSIATVVTDIVTYVQLEIMNVNDAKNDRLILFGEDALLLLLTLLVHLALIVAFATLGNTLYFKLHAPLLTCVIVSDPSEYQKLLPRLLKFPLQFNVRGCARYDQKGVKGFIQEHQAVFLYNVPPGEKAALVNYCYKHKKAVYYDMGLYDIVTRGSVVYNLGDMLFNEHARKGISLHQSIVKRAFDVVVGLLLLALCALPMAVCAVLIKLDDHGKVFFRQDRRSLGGKVFRIVKFRTMREHDDSEPQHSAQEQDERVTRIGRKLRRYRLDELPQLFNVLKGDMSLVGPRPEMLENIDKYTSALPEFAYRERVKAGMTGYAQISGKYSTLPREKLLMDIFYIEQFSLWLDIKLLLRTVIVLMTPESAEAFKKETLAAIDAGKVVDM